MNRRGENWKKMAALECDACRVERARRCRLVDPTDERLRHAPFLEALSIHQNNKHTNKNHTNHTSLVRAEEIAKRHVTGPRRILWVIAKDNSEAEEFLCLKPEQKEAKRRKWLQHHYKDTAGIPGIFPLYHGLRIRLSKGINKHLGL